MLTMDYTSSDESSYEENSDREEDELTAYKVKHLPWERTRLTNAKIILDDIYEKSLSARVHCSLVPRIPHPEQSDRGIPENVVDWAVRTTTPAARGGLTSASSSSSSRSSTDAESSSSRSRTFGTPLCSSTPCASRQMM